MARTRVWMLALTMASTVASRSADGGAVKGGKEPPPALTVQRAPDAMQPESTSGIVLLATDSSSQGEDLYLLETGTSRLQRFAESGKPWGDAVFLRELDAVVPTRMAVGSAGIAVAGLQGVAQYGLDGAQERVRRLFMVGDVESWPKGGPWAISLVNIPRPAKDRFMARKELGEQPPRVVGLGSDLSIGRTGLLSTDLTISSSAAGGRGLVLAASDTRVFAAELANYRVYELDSKLRVLTELTDPKLSFEGPLDAGWSKGQRTEVEGRGSLLTPGGKDLAGSGPVNPASAAITFDYHPLIRDIAWDPSMSRLLILLENDTLAEGAALDVLDPTTGAIERFRLRLPGTTAVLKQISVGRRRIWLRGMATSDHLFFVDKSDILGRVGQRTSLPEAHRETPTDP